MSKLKRVDKLTNDAFSLWLDELGDEGHHALITETLSRAVGAGLLQHPGAPIEELPEAELQGLWEEFQTVAPDKYEEACSVMEGVWLDTLGIEARLNPFHVNARREEMNPGRIAELRLTQDEALKNEYRRWYLEQLRAGRAGELSEMIAGFLRLTIEGVPVHYVNGEEAPHEYNEALEYFQLALYKASQVPTMPEATVSAEGVASWLQSLARDWGSFVATMERQGVPEEILEEIRGARADMEEMAHRYGQTATGERAPMNETERT